MVRQRDGKSGGGRIGRKRPQFARSLRAALYLQCAPGAVRDSWKNARVKERVERERF